jgi:hypothetical protein
MYANVTATVKISGLSAACPDLATEAATVAKEFVPEKIDEFGKIQEDDVKVRIDHLYIRLKHDPASEGIIVVRFNKRDTRRAKLSYLTNLERAIFFLRKDPSRVSFEIVEGESETSTVFWLLPAGGDVRVYSVDASKLIKGEELKAKMKTLFLQK